MSEREVLHQTCIDFRFIEEAEKKAIQQHAYLLAHPGASHNQNLAMRTIAENPHFFGKFVNKDHFQCGVFKNAGDDSLKNHQNHIDKLREKITNIDPVIEFTSMILPFDEKREELYGTTHTCPAAVVLVGIPHVIITAVERLKQDNLIGKHDLIARPMSLTDHDSIIRNLELAMKLHKAPNTKDPFLIYIFDTDNENAIMLEEKIKKIPGNAKIETIIVSEASAQENVA